MRNPGGEEVVEAELVDEVPPRPTALVTDRQAEAVAKFDELVGDAVNRALDARAKVEAEAKAEEESSPTDRAEGWTSIKLNTRKGYEADWRRFEEWAAVEDLEVGLLRHPELRNAHPIEHAAEIEAAFVKVKPATVRDYVNHMSANDLKMTTITRAVAAIGRIHQRYGKPKPTRALVVRDKLAHLRRVSKHRPKRAAPLVIEKLERVMRTFEPRDSLRALRDAAMLSTWFNFALRRAEIRNLDREHASIEWSTKYAETALVVQLFDTKTDDYSDLSIAARENQELCAVRAVREWLEATAELLDDGDPLFPRMRGDVVYRVPMSLRSLDLLVKKVAVAAGFEESDFSTHSLRAGCATSLGSMGVPIHDIQGHLRHNDAKTTQVYIRPEDKLGKDPFRGKV